jgi:hypothetical protein
VPTYAQISDDWFYLLLPKGHTLESFEAAEGAEDREKTKRVLGQMEEELPRTFENLLELQFAYSPALLTRIDNALNQRAVEFWIRRSDPEDPNNFFKLTLSELAVYLGTLLVRENSGQWRYARFPNFFQSTVVVGSVEFHVFDTVMKRCSTDRSHETLATKWQLFQAAIDASQEPQLMS